MINRPKTPFRAIARPESAREPAFVRACEVFVKTLPLALRVALVIGAALFVRELRDVADMADRHEIVVEHFVDAHNHEVPPPREDAQVEPVLNERVRHYLNCTYEDYRNEHFDSCVEQRSQIYRKPEAGTDETGRLLRETDFRYALVVSLDTTTPDS